MFWIVWHLVGGGSVAVAIGVSDMLLVTCNMWRRKKWQVIGNRWYLTCDSRHMTCETYPLSSLLKKDIILSAQVMRLSVCCMRDFHWFCSKIVYNRSAFFPLSFWVFVNYPAVVSQCCAVMHFKCLITPITKVLGHIKNILKKKKSIEISKERTMVTELLFFAQKWSQIALGKNFTPDMWHLFLMSCISATICTRREIQCLPHAVFILDILKAVCLGFIYISEVEGIIFDWPGVAGALKQTPLSLIHSLTNWLTDPLWK